MVACDAALVTDGGLASHVDSPISLLPITVVIGY